jgi:putative copper export protein
MRQILHIIIVLGLTVLFVLAVLTTTGPGPRMAQDPPEVSAL